MADPGQLRQIRLVPDQLQGDPMSLRRNLYRSARILGDAEALASGDPRRIERRAKNKLLGRALGRTGFWRFLWR
ncbi:MAG TPA: hypothetical protein VJU80_12215 [Solirubrobacteraceae bacterium]|nr:hypothetical protein [Solirubrobacteraceae bacterium]